jgi:hypothetical protein
MTTCKQCKCGQKATWIYMPSGQEHPFYCDDCVIDKDSLGCTCNWKSIDGEFAELPEGIEGIDWAWIDAEKAKEYKYSEVKPQQYWQKLQPNGKPWPCCEYWEDEEGFE